MTSQPASFVSETDAHGCPDDNQRKKAGPKSLLCQYIRRQRVFHGGGDTLEDDCHPATEEDELNKTHRRFIRVYIYDDLSRVPLAFISSCRCCSSSEVLENLQQEANNMGSVPPATACVGEDIKKRFFLFLSPHKRV